MDVALRIEPEMVERGWSGVYGGNKVEGDWVGLLGGRSKGGVYCHL